MLRCVESEGDDWCESKARLDVKSFDEEVLHDDAVPNVFSQTARPDVSHDEDRLVEVS